MVTSTTDDLAGLLLRRRQSVDVAEGTGRTVAADRLPAEIPLRESKALALAPLLDDAGTRPLVARYADTATDVLRLLAVRSGGDPDLLEPPRLRGLTRPVRRELLALLDRLDFARLAEDMARHPRAWKRVGEILHPFEGAHRHARVALAFAVLRGTRLDDTRLGGILLAEAGRHACVRLVGDRLRVVTWQSRVEDALGRWDTTAAARLLGERPGELLAPPRPAPRPLRLRDPAGAGRRGARPRPAAHRSRTTARRVRTAHDPHGAGAPPRLLPARAGDQGVRGRRPPAAAALPRRGPRR
ncbi:hypothetical protein [Streptomyces alfalfae]|uniref:Uncharacterized protein n=1 Tax=Streptomyces alfalfae TaxID=1642299 RepID=A0ABM6GSB1_9ACTN|nr:hypothetical protein [Streptomyces alfalfae]APY86104.1 hypothetical protein A7J05_10660 [Streptomyces alfalfae]